MMQRVWLTIGLVLITVCSLVPTATADPCGMVPPIVIGQQAAITRVGNQMTYVFFKDGVETVVIRPGFIGSVEEFGMLIPFPAVPSLRKVSDNVFPHIAAAVDPPEVVVDLRHRFLGAVADAAPAPPGALGGGFALRRRSVRVIKQEAVGMYEVAVLEAGSAAALQKWMTAHHYRYPEGMDQATNDYIESGWCFVAVKTRVGNKRGVEPRPGQRKVNPKLSQGTIFDGHVQAMGFRFRVEELVVPMRLSTFNKGNLHNVVYLLTDRPQRINSIPSKFVVRQLSGEQLYKNVTEPLPLRVIGGSVEKLRPFHRRNLKQRRNPVPKNGIARDLFASDLLAVRTKRLSHSHEEDGKMLLRIGERLGLRGEAYNRLHEQQTQKSRDQVVKQALQSLKSMTLTVVSGEFPRDVLANQNLTFSGYVMADARNSPKFYDAIIKAPRKKREGRVYHGPLKSQPKQGNPGAIPGAVPSQGRKSAAPRSRPQNSGAGVHVPPRWWRSAIGIVAMLAALGCVLVCTTGRQSLSKRTALGLLLAVVLIGGAWNSLAAQKADAAADTKSILALIDQLEDPKRASAAADELIALGEAAVPHLLGEAAEGQAMTVRGWSIVCLAGIGGEQADQRLVQLQDDPKQPQLLRTWAAAARVEIADTSQELVKLSALVRPFPSVARPIGKKMLQKLQSSDKDGKVSTEELLQLTLNLPQLNASLAPAILAQGSQPLIAVMMQSKTTNARRQAAAFLGTLAAAKQQETVSEILAAYRFDPQAKTLPWAGGPLFVPSLKWTPDQAKTLAGNLIAWYLWCDVQGSKKQQAAIHNNLRSLRLARAAGYQSPGFRQASTAAWLLNWGKVVGRPGIEAILKQQGVDQQQRFQDVLKQLQ